MILLALLCAAAAARYTSFKPGELWLDTDGNEIRAHSGGVTYNPDDDKFYWYGSDGYPGGNATLNRKINVYSSAGDLYNWKFEGVALNFPLHPKCNREGMTCYADRCKVLRHSTNSSQYAPNSQYVMWCKSKPYVSVSVSASPIGPFKLVDLFAPAGHEVGDCTAFADPVTSHAYYVLSIHPSSYGISKNEKRQLRIFPLTADWLNLTHGQDEGDASTTFIYRNITPPFPLPNKYDGKLEAPSPFFFNPTHSDTLATYYLWTSHCTYWFPNDALLLSSPSLMSDAFWDRSGGNPTHNDTSFSTQSTQVLHLTKPSGSKYIYISDRFEPFIEQNTTGRYVWLPLTVEATGKVSVKWASQWTL